MFSLSKVNQNQIKADFRYDLNNNVAFCLWFQAAKGQARRDETLRNSYEVSFPLLEIGNYGNDMMEEKKWTEPQRAQNLVSCW